MSTSYQPTNEDEPIGIVISRGRRTEEAPRFSAYVWGQAPDGGATRDVKAA